MAEKSFFQLIDEETPEITKAFFALVHTLEKDCGLDAKTFQLVYLGIRAAGGIPGAIAAHVPMAKKAGATREEVRGAILISLMSSGVVGVSTCLAAALEAYDNA